MAKKAVKKAKAKSKSVFDSMKYGRADVFCSKAGRELKTKHTSRAGKALRRCS
jgi:hypothetical protein